MYSLKWIASYNSTLPVVFWCTQTISRSRCIIVWRKLSKTRISDNVHRTVYFSKTIHFFFRALTLITTPYFHECKHNIIMNPQNYATKEAFCSHTTSVVALTRDFCAVDNFNRVSYNVGRYLYLFNAWLI